MYSLTLWLGIPGERRVWLEQWRGIPLILKNLSLYFPSIKIYVDGMTAYDGERIEVANNLEAFWKIVENTREAFENANKPQEMFCHSSNQSEAHNAESKNSYIIYSSKGEKIAFKSLSGYDYRTKICYGAMCDIAISEISTTSLVPFCFCKKPGVGFCCVPSNDNYAQNLADEIPHLKISQHKYYAIANKTGIFHFSFHIPPEHFYNLVAEVLEELALENKLQHYNVSNPLKMHRLPVPPVELYAKKYQLEQKTQIQLHSNPSTERLMQEIAHQKTFLELESLELDIQLKKLQIQQFNPTHKFNNTQTTNATTAKERIHSHLAYKLGSAMILNSKSLWGYIRMPYVLSYIKESHRIEQQKYQESILKNPKLKLPKLESYPDYKEAIKEKECFTYKLGAALMQADKDWYKGGYLRFYFKEVPRLKRELKEKK